MIRWLTTVLLVAATTGAMVSCEMPWAEKTPRATPVRFPKPVFPEAARGNPRPVGKILTVNREGNFVLIDCAGWALPDAGSALKSFRDNVETGVITVSAERKGTHVIADIAVGSPQRGDEVFQ